MLSVDLVSAMHCVSECSIFACAECSMRLICWAQVLLGYREIPKKEAAILSVLNPATEGARVDIRAWNVGDGRIKLLAYKPKKDEKQKGKEQERDNVTEQNALSTVADV